MPSTNSWFCKCHSQGHFTGSTSIARWRRRVVHEVAWWQKMDDSLYVHGGRNNQTQVLPLESPRVLWESGTTMVYGEPRQTHAPNGNWKLTESIFQLVSESAKECWLHQLPTPWKSQVRCVYYDFPPDVLKFKSYSLTASSAKNVLAHLTVLKCLECVDQGFGLNRGLNPMAVLFVSWSPCGCMLSQVFGAISWLNVVS